MQNNNKPSGFRRFIRDNGYYFIIGVCVLTIGASAYFLLREDPMQEEAESVSLNVPVTIEAGEPTESLAETPAAAVEDTVAAAESSEPAAVTEPEQEASMPVSDWAAVEQIPASRTVLAPLSGETIAAYSVSALAYNETTRDWRTHSGIDLAAEQGTPVSAAEAGTVSAVYEDDYFGMTVEITHDSGYTTVYSNLDTAPCVTVGQFVSAGEEIGAVGTSALLEIGQRAHLHFAVTKDGEHVDPMEYLS